MCGSGCCRFGVRVDHDLWFNVAKRFGKAQIRNSVLDNCEVPFQVMLHLRRCGLHGDFEPGVLQACGQQAREWIVGTCDQHALQSRRWMAGAALRGLLGVAGGQGVLGNDTGAHMGTGTVTGYAALGGQRP